MANADEAPLTRIIAVPTPAVATAGNDATTVLGVVGEDETVTAVTYIPNSTITGAATNNRTLTVVDKGAAGSGNTTVATINYANGTNATGLIENVVPLSGTAANLNVTAGDVLVLTSAHVGTGIADPGGLLRVTLARR